VVHDGCDCLTHHSSLVSDLCSSNSRYFNSVDYISESLKYQTSTTDGVTANYNDNIFGYTLLNDAGKRDARSLHGYNRSDYSAWHGSYTTSNPKACTKHNIIIKQASR